MQSEGLYIDSFGLMYRCINSWFSALLHLVQHDVEHLKIVTYQLCICSDIEVEMGFYMVAW